MLFCNLFTPCIRQLLMLIKTFLKNETFFCIACFTNVLQTSELSEYIAIRLITLFTVGKLLVDFIYILQEPNCLPTYTFWLYRVYIDC